VGAGFWSAGRADCGFSSVAGVTATQVLLTAAFPVKVPVSEGSCSRLTFAPGKDAATCQPTPGSRWLQPCGMAMVPGGYRH
jgi:hypothetical protein